MPPRRDRLARLLGRRVASLRQEQGLTQEKLAWEANLKSKGYLSRIESGERLPSLDVLHDLADRLGVEVRDLFVFPEHSVVDEAMESVRCRGAAFARQVITQAAQAERRPSRRKS